MIGPAANGSHHTVELTPELEHSGASAGLGEGDVPSRERPSDGTVGWYTRFCDFRPQERLPRLYALVERMAGRLRAGRTLFLPGAWLDHGSPPLEYWKVSLLDLVTAASPPLGTIVPTEPAAALYARARQRVREGDAPASDHPDAPGPV